MNQRSEAAQPDTVREMAQKAVDANVAYRRACYPGMGGGQREEMLATVRHWMDQLDNALRATRPRSAEATKVVDRTATEVERDMLMDERDAYRERCVSLLKGAISACDVLMDMTVGAPKERALAEAERLRQCIDENNTSLDSNIARALAALPMSAWGRRRESPRPCDTKGEGDAPVSNVGEPAAGPAPGSDLPSVPLLVVLPVRADESPPSGTGAVAPAPNAGQADFAKRTFEVMNENARAAGNCRDLTCPASNMLKQHIAILRNSLARMLDVTKPITLDVACVMAIARERDQAREVLQVTDSVSHEGTKR